MIYFSLSAYKKEFKKKKSYCNICILSFVFRTINWWTSKKTLSESFFSFFFCFFFISASFVFIFPSSFSSFLLSFLSVHVQREGAPFAERSEVLCCSLAFFYFHLFFSFLLFFDFFFLPLQSKSKGSSLAEYANNSNFLCWFCSIFFFSFSSHCGNP